MATLITGSYAFDTIMVFPDQFKNHILPEQMHILNVCFLVPQLRREFGGCAGNIAYNLKLLGGDPLPMATVGEDFQPYRAWLAANAIDDRHVVEIAHAYTAQAFLTTDADNNQITAFHPGAMEQAQQNRVTDAAQVELGIVAPDGRTAMLEHAAQFAAAGIPFFFDPGQGLPMFTAEELNRFIDQANYLVVNDYEAALLQQKTGSDLARIADRVDALIVTLGAQGAMIHTDGSRHRVAAIDVRRACDPTGCGDAFRAGLLYGSSQKMDWCSAAQLGAVMGGIKIEHHGTQNHHPDRAEIEARYRENFGDPPACIRSAAGA